MDSNQKSNSPSHTCPGSNPPTDAPAGPDRRNFIHWCIGAMTAMAAAIIAFPVFSFIKLPKRIGGSGIIEVLLEDLNEDLALYFNRDGIQIALIYTNSQPQVFDASCTHLGCLVAWDQTKHIFFCPCHGAVFDENGDPVSGPVNTPLRKVDFEIKDDTLIIT